MFKSQIKCYICNRRIEGSGSGAGVTNLKRKQTPATKDVTTAALLLPTPNYTSVF